MANHLFAGGPSVAIKKFHKKLIGTASVAAIAVAMTMVSSAPASAGCTILGTVATCTGDTTIPASFLSDISVGETLILSGSLTILDGGFGFTTINGTLNMQNSVAGDTLTIQDVDPVSSRMFFDFNGTTGASDRVIADGLHPSVGNQIFVRNLGGDPTARGVAPLLQITGVSSPAVPLSASAVSPATHFSFGSGGDPSNSEVKYVLLERTVTGPSDPFAGSFDSHDLYLVYFPTSSGPLGVQTPLQSTSAKSQVSSVDQLGGEIVGKETGSGGPATQVVSPVFGMWASGRVGVSAHDGFDVTTNGATTRSADYTTKDVSLLASAQLDLAKYQQIEGMGLKVGAFGGFAKSFTDLGTSTALLNVGIADAGKGDNTSFMAGGFVLASVGNLYGLAIGSGSWGESNVTDNAILATSKYDTSGYVLGGVGGMIIPLAEGDPRQFGSILNLDLRAGVSYASNTGDAHSDSIGNQIGKAQLTQVKGSASATLSTVMQMGSLFLVPKVQAGIEHRFSYDNSVIVNGGEVKFTDDDNNYFALVGVNTQASESVSLFANARGDFNQDQRIYSAQVGVKFLLN